MVVAPLFQAITPRLSRMRAAGDDTGFVDLYHLGSQLVTVTGGVAGLMIAIFPDWIMTTWTANPKLAGEVAPILRWLALGYVFNLLMWMPYQAQLAYRWTSLAFKINVVAVIVLVPALLWAVPKFGPISAAVIWTILNACYVLIGLHLMHRRILQTEKWRWYVSDVAVPLAAAGACIGTARFLLTSPPPDRILQACLLIGIGGVACGIAIAFAPLLNAHVLSLWRARVLRVR
jgi:O-antigen/teichoic acid export membrane protein